MMGVHVCHLVQMWFMIKRWECEILRIPQSLGFHCWHHREETERMTLTLLSVFHDWNPFLVLLLTRIEFCDLGVKDGNMTLNGLAVSFMTTCSKRQNKKNLNILAIGF